MDPINGLGLRVCDPGVSGLRCSFQAPGFARREGEPEITRIEMGVAGLRDGFREHLFSDYVPIRTPNLFSNQILLPNSYPNIAESKST